MELQSPLLQEHMPFVWKLLQEFKRQTLDDSGPKSVEEIAEHLKLMDANGSFSFLVVHNNQPVGAVWADALKDGTHLGHLVFERKSLSSAEKLQAAKDALAEMFARGAKKIWWASFADNRVFTRFLRHLGATYDRALPNQERRGGVLVDVVVMASEKQ